MTKFETALQLLICIGWICFVQAQNSSSINGRYDEAEAEQSKKSGMDERLQILFQSAVDAKDCEWTADALAEDRTFQYINSIQNYGEKKEDLGGELLEQLMSAFSRHGFEWEGDSFSAQQKIINALDMELKNDYEDEDTFLISTYWNIFTALKDALHPIIQQACDKIIYSK
eukprot:TRINITY_DN4356_c0_g2_i1.p1 TRINITY_DN4356_c0_g2~~TRINITY_DN4356_c0_g2_i1.p1  ORF type:complete len:171 (-),score=31.39 TRINITY_DN4356_c0_g2_i1:44-556(-)